jgi:hypothetical protein
MSRSEDKKAKDSPADIRTRLNRLKMDIDKIYVPYGVKL